MDKEKMFPSSQNAIIRRSGYEIFEESRETKRNNSVLEFAIMKCGGNKVVLWPILNVIHCPDLGLRGIKKELLSLVRKKKGSQEI